MGKEKHLPWAKKLEFNKPQNAKKKINFSLIEF
jgi:hypothetical protein